MAVEALPSSALRRPRRSRPTGHSAASNAVVYVVATVVIVLMLAPVAYIVIGGFRTNSQITDSPAGFPAPWVASNYLDVLTGGLFWRLVGNSLIVGLLTTLGVVVLGLMASFAIARYEYRLRGAMYALFAAGLMFPVTVAITPLYIVVKNLGLTNTLAGVILPQIAFGLPTTIIILVPFLRAIPVEIQEAAEIDGASRLGFFWRMVIPLSLPGVVTVGILAFIGSWNGYLLPQYSVDTARVLAFTSLSMLPALIFFSIFQRRIVGGLTGAVKG
jgi:raffinose/stachyose/melibiose transport system permease protein